jgi:transposase
MEVLHPILLVLDVHKETVVACVRHMTGGKVKTEVRTFATTPGRLLELSAWLGAGQVHPCRDGGHRSLLEAGVAHSGRRRFSAPAGQRRACEERAGPQDRCRRRAWLADLLAHGLIRASFVPDQPTQEMRDLLRTRKQLVRERISHTQRMQKTLEDANIKLDSVLTNIMGASGRDILEALIGGETDPEQLLTLLRRGVKAPAEKVKAALQGRVTERHRFLLRLHLCQIDALDAAITDIDKEVNRELDPFRQAVRQLRTIPGISDLTAQVIVSEIGINMTRFPTAGHLISWAGAVPAQR